MLLDHAQILWEKLFDSLGVALQKKDESEFWVSGLVGSATDNKQEIDTRQAVPAGGLLFTSKLNTEKFILCFITTKSKNYFWFQL